MSRLFHRAARVTVIRQTPGVYGDASLTNDIVEITDLRVSFAIEKHVGREPNTAEVTIYNLAERSRAEMQKTPLHVRIDAGYDGQLERIFTGDVRWAESRHEGVDWITKLQLGDGDRGFRYARVNRSYKAGVDARTAVVEAAKALGYKARLSPIAERELRAQFAAGLTMYGTARDELTRLLSPYGMSWSVQDGRLQIFRPGEYRTEQPIEITQDTGLIGTPEFGAPEKKGKPPTLTFRTLLKPTLTAGGRVRVASRSVQGTFKLLRVTHDGDTHGEAWYSECEAIST